VLKVISTWGCIAAAHKRFSCIRQVSPMYTPYIERQIWLPWQPPLVAGYQQYLCFVGRPLKPPPPIITKCLVTIIHAKPVIAILVTKLVAMVVTVRHSISATVCLHRIAWFQKPTPRNKQRVASYHTIKIIAHQKPKIGCHGNFR